MPANWEVLLWMGVAALLLWLVQRQLHRHIQGLVLLLTGNDYAAALAHFFLLMPGITVHEMSHWAAARLLGVRAGPISIGPERKRGRQIRFGSVQIGRTDAVRESLIGLAPLVSGTALVLLLARWGFGLLPNPLPVVAEWPSRLAACLKAADAWLWVYLIFAVSNTMQPSESDRRAWRTFALYLVLVLAVAYLLIGVPRVPGQWLIWGLHFLSYLAFAFTLTAILDLIALAILLSLEWLAGLLTGRHVEYL